MIPRGYLPYMLADPFDNTGSLMAKDRRKRRGQLPIPAPNVGMTDADRHNPDEHIRGLKIRELDLFNDKRAVQAVNNRGSGLHWFPITCATAFA